MGCFVSILLGLVALAVFCVLMDLLTLVYELAWIVPIVIVVIFIIRFIVRPDFRGKVSNFILGKKCSNKFLEKDSDVPPQAEMNTQSVINDLIDIAMMDGVLSEREKRAVIMKAAEMGIEPDKAEVMIELRLAELARKN